MEERRLLAAVALSLLVLTGYQLLFPAKRAPRPTPAPSGAVRAVAPPSAPPPAVAAPLDRLPVAPAAIADDRERRVEAQGVDMTVAFTNRGARLVSWRLARFTDSGGRAEEMVESVPGGPRPLDLETGDAVVDERLRGALFRPSAEILSLSGAGEKELRFDFSEGDLTATKALRFPPSGYLVSITARVEKAGQPLPVKVLWGPGVGNPTPAEMEVQGYQPPHAVVLTGSGLERPMPDKVGPSRSLVGAHWVGVESHYFAALFVPPPGGGSEIRTLTLPGDTPDKPRLVPEAAVLLPGPDAQALLYVGPKDYPTLAKEGHGLAQVVPVGEWIGPIVVPLMKLLNWVHGHVGNYGWSIVVLTVLINVAMSPLRHYSIANGVKMAKLSPEMKVIQERYRKVPALDPKRQEMQKEIAALYERHGMSMGTQMAVGCLPLLLTMPFLIAFYRVLQVSIELRGSPFLWIPDLSQKDPLYITPLLMGVSMFVMQRMTPSTMDPAQQRMMMIMPLVLVVMFFAAPSGLNLYWLASNVCSILQQGVTLRLIRGAEGDQGRRDRRAR